MEIAVNGKIINWKKYLLYGAVAIAMLIIYSRSKTQTQEQTKK